MRKALVFILCCNFLMYAAKSSAVINETGGVTIIHPYNPMAYPDTTMHNSDYYFAPDNIVPSELYNPNDNVPYRHSYPTYLDSMISNKIKDLIQKDSILNGADIRVVTNHGIVNLEGTVVSQDQIDEAISVVQSVDGVKTVKSQFTIIHPW